MPESGQGELHASPESALRQHNVVLGEIEMECHAAVKQTHIAVAQLRHSLLEAAPLSLGPSFNDLSGCTHSNHCSSAA